MDYKLLLFIIGLSINLPVDAFRRPRIYGGEDADPSNFRYHVAILKKDPTTGEPRHVCGGAIIDRKYILTAAHCVYDLNHDDVIVRAGGNDAPPEDKPYLERRSFHQVAKVMYPKAYVKDASYHEYDVAVLKIKGTFDLANENLYKKVQLPNFHNDYEDKYAKVAGFGVHDMDNREVPINGDGFRSLRTQVISNDDCQESRTYILTRGSLCTSALESNGHTCYGDGGDPLVYDNQVIGVLNAPSTCDPKLPELYTRVSTYVDFIKKILAGRVSADVEYR